MRDDALVPSNQIAEVRRAFLQTRIDALADELLPKTGTEDTAHQAYLADIDAMDAAVAASAAGDLTAAQRDDVTKLSDSWTEYETLVSGPYLQAAREGRMADFMTMRSNVVGPASASLNEALTSLLEPVMIVFMGLVVGFIVFSVLMPILQINNLAGG